jgi:hypothetical protein
MNLDNICKYCEARIYKDVMPTKRHYSVPKVVRELWQRNVGDYLLGPFYKVHCEVCHKHMAVFDRPKGELEGKIIVLYMCTFSDTPASEKCATYGNCYNCPVPKEQKAEGIRKYY